MQIGKLNKRGVIEQLTQTVSNGETVDTYSTLASRWFSIRALSAREMQIAGLTQALVSHEIETHYYAAIKPSMRIVCEGRVFQIIGAVDPDGRKAVSRLQVIEVVNLTTTTTTTTTTTSTTSTTSSTTTSTTSTI